VTADAAPASSDGCGVTVLGAINGGRATKQFKWNPTLHEWVKISYEAGAWFHPIEHQVHNLGELVQILDAVRGNPRAFVVRGALAPWAREQIANDPERPIRRRKHFKNGVEPSLIEVSRRWIMIDVDNWPLPGGSDLADDPDGAIDTAIYELLPEAFHDAECWWQLSASAGFSPGFLKVHLFFWLAEPATNEHIKAVLKQHAPGVDRAPFSAAQPHYIADPIIQGGHDPLPRRTGWRKGMEPAVQLPVLLPRVQRPHPAGAGATGRSGSLADALTLLGHGEGRESFHAPLRTATLRYARECGRGRERDDETIKEFLRDAIRAAPCRQDGNVETPYCQDWYLQPMIDGAFALLAGDAEIRTMRPHHPAPAHTVGEARAAIAEHVGAFLRRALAWHQLDGKDQEQRPPEHAALVVDVGVGKSTAAREAIAGYIAAMREADRPHRVLWLVPTHKLGNETLAAMGELGLSVAVMRGREADDPSTGDPENDEPPLPMCLNLPAVEDALKVGADVERAACGSGREGEPACPYRTECAYQRQKAPVARADVVIAAHQALFHELPKEVRAGLGLVIADESWWQAGLRPNAALQVATFAETPLVYPVIAKEQVGQNGRSKTYRIVRREEATNDLHAWSAMAQVALDATVGDELISREAALATALTDGNCSDAEKLEWQRKVEGTVWPGMTPEARQKGVEQAAGNAGIARRVGVWRALRELLQGDATHTGRLQAGTRKDHGELHKVVLLHTRTEVRDSIAGLPILLLDATMPVEVVRYFLPRLEVLAEVKAAAPHMEVHQVIGGWGKTSLVPSDRQTPEENRRRENVAAELVDFARLNSGGNALVITYEAIEQRFAAPGIRTGHFNAIAGLDGFRDVRSLFVIGRPLPDGRELRAAALALTGRAIMPEDGQNETRGVLMADGTGAAMNVRAYSDPDLEALRRAITEAEVIQAIGRGRGVNRDASSPLAVFVLADVALPLPVKRLLRWEDARLDVVSRMLARGRVLLGATDAAKAYPDLFPTPDAARMAIQRSRAGGHFPNIPLGISILGECPGNRPVEVEYRPAGRGQQERCAFVLPELLAGLPAWLTALVGPLAHYAEHVPEPPPPPPPMAEKPPERPRPPPDAAPAPVEPPMRVRVLVRPPVSSWGEPVEDGWPTRLPPQGGGAPVVSAAWGRPGDD